MHKSGFNQCAARLKSTQIKEDVRPQESNVEVGLGLATDVAESAQRGLIFALLVKDRGKHDSIGGKVTPLIDQPGEYRNAIIDPTGDDRSPAPETAHRGRGQRTGFD